MKLKSLFSIKKLLLCVVFLALVALVNFAMRDMELDVDLLRESLMASPGISIENIHMKREISGDLWQLQIPLLSREEDMIVARSLDVNRTVGNLDENAPGQWYFFCREAHYYHAQNFAQAKGLLGTIESGTKIFNLESPLLEWRESDNNLVFPEGLSFYDEEFFLRTKSASMDLSGLVILDKGVEIQWQKPLDM